MVNAVGLDETLYVREGRYRRQRWSTQVVDVQHGQLLDVLDGKDVSTCCAWFAARATGWCDGVAWATLDLSSSYRTVFDTMLPTAVQVADPFHVVRLGNTALDECRRRVQNETVGHRGRKDDPLYRARRRLVMAAERLTVDGMERLRGLLDAGDTASPDGVISEAAVTAIGALLEQSLAQPDPADEACRRHHAAHQANYRTGERVRARHILFAVTPGVDVAALRKRAEAALLDVRCFDGPVSGKSSYAFGRIAGELSNCPSGAAGGDLGWLAATDCAPEFARELFGHAEVGVLPRLVHSRFGLHVVEVLEREPGVAQSFEAVRGAVLMSLRQQAYVTALRQYLGLLAGAATIEGVDLDAADTPLVQ